MSYVSSLIKTALCFAALTISSAALHAEPGVPPATKAQAWAPPPLPECTCRAQGQNFRLGEQTCLATPDGYRMAQCELTQNVTNWHFSTSGCTISRRAPRDRQTADICRPPATVGG